MILKEFEHWVWIVNPASYWDYHTIIMPKRHFIKYSEMKFKESKELGEIIDYCVDKMLGKKLVRADGSLVEKVVHFWRYRLNRFDPISGTLRPDHLHLHLTPDKDHLWDKVIDRNAYKWDINILKEEG